MTYWVFNS